MWVHRLVAPYEFERIEVLDLTEQQLGDGQVLLSFVAAGVCGSDLPAFRGAQGRLPGDSGASAAEKNGFPIHEIVGDVLASRHPRHRPGDRVVGWASGFDGLMQRVISDGDGLAGFDPTLTPAEAVGLQPLACVLYAIEAVAQHTELAGRHVAVLGQGRSACCSARSPRPPAPGGSPESTRSTAARSPPASASTPSCSPPATAGCAIWTPRTGRRS